MKSKRSKHLSKSKSAAYYVSLDKFADTAREIFLIDVTTSTLKEDFCIDFFEMEGVDAGIFNVTLTAKSKKDALKKALILRNELIDDGFWNIACSLNNLQYLMDQAIGSGPQTKNRSVNGKRKRPVETPIVDMSLHYK